MANPHKFWLSSEGFQLRTQFGRAQVHPANDSEDEGIRVRQLQQPLRFLHCLPNLNDNTALKSIVLE